MFESDATSPLPLLIVKKCRGRGCGFHPIEEIIQSFDWTSGYCCAAIEIIKEARRAYRRKNKARINAGKQAARKTPEGRARQREKDQRRRLTPAYQQRKFEERMRRTEHIKAGDLTGKEIKNLKEAAHSCQYCGADFLPGMSKTTDHIIPLSRGGAHTSRNVVICCRSCNDNKGTRTILEWAIIMGDKLLPQWRYVRESVA